jgi:hypothetical protein
VTDIGIGDLINAIFKRPERVSAPEEDEEQVKRQIRPATPQEMAEIEALAAKAALLQDEVKLILAKVDELVGARSKMLSSMKAELLDRMLNHNLTEVWVPGRPAVEVVVKKERKASKKGIIAALSKSLGDEKKGALEGNALWNSLPQVDKQTLSIPDPSPPEGDSPY